MDAGWTPVSHTDAVIGQDGVEHEDAVSIQAWRDDAEVRDDGSSACLPAPLHDTAADGRATDVSADISSIHDVGDATDSPAAAPGQRGSVSGGQDTATAGCGVEGAGDTGPGVVTGHRYEVTNTTMQCDEVHCVAAVFGAVVPAEQTTAWAL